MREPVGCNEEEAIKYMGCSKTMFETLRASSYVVPIKKGWYSYRQLDLAVDRLTEEAIGKCTVIRIHESTPEKRRVVGSKGNRSDFPKTEELLRIHRERSGQKG